MGWPCKAGNRDAREAANDHNPVDKVGTNSKWTKTDVHHKDADSVQPILERQKDLCDDVDDLVLWGQDCDPNLSNISCQYWTMLKRYLETITAWMDVNEAMMALEKLKLS